MDDGGDEGPAFSRCGRGSLDFAGAAAGRGRIAGLAGTLPKGNPRNERLYRGSRAHRLMSCLARIQPIDVQAHRNCAGGRMSEAFLAPQFRVKVSSTKRPIIAGESSVTSRAKLVARKARTGDPRRKLVTRDTRHGPYDAFDPLAALGYDIGMQSGRCVRRTRPRSRQP